MAKNKKPLKSNSKAGQVVQSNRSKKPEVNKPLHPWIEAILRPQSIFLFLAVVFGLLFTFTLPPFQVPDEAAHMFRAYQLSKFDLKVDTQSNVYGNYLPPSPDNYVAGAYLPASFDSVQMKFHYLKFQANNKTSKKAIDEACAIQVEPEKKKFTEITAGAYSFFNYIPQLPAIVIGRVFQLNVLPLFYLGRLFALAFYILCVYFSIRIIPFGKNILLAVGLIPISLTLAGSYSGDCVILSFTFLAVALSLYHMTRTVNSLKNGKLIFLITIIALLGLLKPIYFPIILMLLLIPSKSFEQKKEYYLTLLIPFSISIILIVVWQYVTSQTVVANAALIGKDIIQTPSYQFHRILANPFILFDILTQTIQAKGVFYYKSLIGILGYLDTWLPKWIYNAYYVLLIAVALLDYTKSYTFSMLQRSLIVFMSVGIFLGTIFIMFILDGIESKDTLVAQGVQGRYLIPPLMTILFALYGILPFNKSFQWFNKFMPLLIGIVCFVVLYQTEYAMYLRYFVEGNEYAKYILG